MRPQLAVVALLAAGGFVAGGYFLWPKPRHVAGAFRADTWVDPVTYVTLQARISTHGWSSTMLESWLRRNRRASPRRGSSSPPASVTRR